MHSGRDESGRLKGDEVLPVIEVEEKNPFGTNRKARRAQKAEDRRATRRIKRLIRKLER